MTPARAANEIELASLQHLGRCRYGQVPRSPGPVAIVLRQRHGQDHHRAVRLFGDQVATAACLIAGQGVDVGEVPASAAGCARLRRSLRNPKVPPRPYRAEPIFRLMHASSAPAKTPRMRTGDHRPQVIRQRAERPDLNLRRLDPQSQYPRRPATSRAGPARDMRHERTSANHVLLIILVDPRVRRQGRNTNGGGADVACGQKRDGAS
jgi:hypothetical protein